MSSPKCTTYNIIIIQGWNEIDQVTIFSTKWTIFMRFCGLCILSKGGVQRPLRLFYSILLKASFSLVCSKYIQLLREQQNFVFFIQWTQTVSASAGILNLNKWGLFPVQLEVYYQQRIVHQMHFGLLHSPAKFHKYCTFHSRDIFCFHTLL